MGDRCFLSDYRCTLTIPCVGLDRKNNTQCLVHQYLDCSQSHKMCTMGEYRSSKIWCRLIICNIPTCFQHLLYSKKPEYRDYIRKFISFFGMLISFSRHLKCEKRTFYRSVLKLKPVPSNTVFIVSFDIPYYVFVSNTFPIHANSTIFVFTQLYIDFV